MKGKLTHKNLFTISLRPYLILLIAFGWSMSSTGQEIISEEDNWQDRKNSKENIKIYEETGGVVAVEAEHFYSQTHDSVRKWYTIKEGEEPIKGDADKNHLKDASGDQYLEILPDTRVTHADDLQKGVNFTNEPGKMGILYFKVHFNTTGKYYVWVRAYSTGTEDNGLHVGVDGKWPDSGKRLQWCEGKNQWTWESKQRTADEHCGIPKGIWLTIENTGEHIISFSMREDGFEFDKWMMSLSYNKPEGKGPDERLK